MTISHRAAISPPERPVRPTVVRPRRRAAARPPSTFGERPEVEIPTKTSPERPSASIWRENIRS